MRSSKRLLKTICGNSRLRVLVSILFILNIVFSVVFAQVFSFLYNNNFYLDNGNALHENITNTLMEQDSHDALLYLNEYLQSSSVRQREKLEAFESQFSEKNTNFSFLFRQNDYIILSNFEASHFSTSYYPNPDTFFFGDDSFATPDEIKDLTFEGHLKEPLEVKDAYYRMDRFFSHAGIIKYSVLAFLFVSTVMNLVYGYLLIAVSGRRSNPDELYYGEFDRIPMYILLPFSIPIFAGGIEFVRSISKRLLNLGTYLRGTEFRPYLYGYLLLLTVLAFLLRMLISTISVRLKEPSWWQKSTAYRAFHANQNEKRFPLLLTVLTALQIAAGFLILLLPDDKQFLLYLLADFLFSAVLILIIYIFGKDFSAVMKSTDKLVHKSIPAIPTVPLSDSTRTHAENINFLNRSANAENEKRFVNESFSTRLIHNVSHNLRVPLTEVSRNVSLLESGTLEETARIDCVEKINDISQNLKKTIEDLIRISKATTGNISPSLMQTDLCMLMMQMTAEFYESFEQHRLQLVSEYPETPVQIMADGECMWYIVEGLISVLLKKSVPDTRIFLTAKQSGNRAMLLLHTTVHGTELSEDAFTPDSGLGLATAKVFTELQGGTMRYKCRHDLLTVALSFPTVSETTNE